MPIDVNISDFYVEKDGITKDITSTLLPNISLNYPNLSNLESPLQTTLSFTKANSNNVDIINFTPDKLILSAISTTNPTGIPTSNFIIDTSNISLNTELEILFMGVL